MAFRPLDLGDDSSRREVKGLLGAESADEGQKQLALRIYGHVGAAQYVIVEDDYIDLNFRAEFSKLHYIRHRDTMRRCRRLHFFAQRPTDDAEELQDQICSIKNAYLGYVVIRPLPSHAPSRAVFSTELPRARGSRYVNFVTCRASYAVSIAGVEFSFEGCPWMHQDKIVSACATAALWTVNTHFSSRHSPDFRTYHTSEIADLATKYNLTLGRSIPSKGLTNEQMMVALNQMGYEPIFYSPSDDSEARRLIYYYVESGIPVILSLYFPHLGGGHVVVAVGHTMITDGSENGGGMTAFRSGAQVAHGYRSSDFVPSFIVQDDARGPFEEIEIVSFEKPSKVDLDNWPQETLRDVYACRASVVMEGSQDDGPLTGYLHNILVALPPWVTLDAVEAEIGSIHTIHREEYWTGMTDLGYWRSLCGKDRHAPAVFRTFLRPSNHLKSYWLKNRGVRKEFAHAMGSHLMSRWVWVTEMIGLDEFLAGEGAEAFALVIQDAAGLPEGDVDLIALYVGHRLWLYPPDGGAPEEVGLRDVGVLRFDNRQFDL